MTLLPTADSYVVSTQPTTNHGSNNQLTSRATSPILETFLKFDLPAAPAGTTLTGASLTVRTSNDATAATNDATELEVVGNGWAEDTITWNNRPTGAGVPFGTLASAPALNTHYTVDGSPAALRDNLGAAVSLRATGTGGDSIRLWSRQGPSATYYPELTLTFTATTTDNEAPTAPTNLAAQVTDDDVALSWDASSDNVGVTDYRVYRGATAGFTPDNASHLGDVTAPTRTYTDSNRPAGTYYYKVIARDAAGNTSTPTAAVEATVTTPPPADNEAPTAPTNLAAQVTDDDVALSWDASSDNVGVTDYRVYRGATAGFTPDNASHLGDVTAPTRTYTDSNRPAGTYYYKVIARDAAGNTSTPTAAVEATVTTPPPADNEAPTAPTNLAAQVTDDDVALSWDASSDNVGVTDYRVYRGATAGFTPDNASHLGDVTAPTRTYTDSNRPAGTYYYKVIARDAAGNTSTPTAAVEATVTTPPPATDPVTVQLLPTADSYVVSTQPNTNHGTNNQLTSRATSPILETFLKFDLPAAPAGTTLTGARLKVRTSNDATAATNDATDFEVVGNAWAEDTITWNNRPTGTGVPFATLASAPALNTHYTVTGTPAALRDNLGAAVSLRATGTGGDSIRIWSRQGPSTSYYPELTLTFTPTTTDNEAPTAPTNLAAQVTDDDVALSWDASSDNVGVTRYRVYRGTTAGFTPDNGSYLDEVLAPTLTYTDSNRPPGTYYYKVIARDAAGNLSAASAAAEAAVAAPPPAPVTVRLFPSADSYVVSTQANTNYGTNNQLTSRATSPILETFLKFDLPAAPAGTTLTGASLKVRTSNDVTAATTNATNFEVVGSAWAEDTITWNNRPTGTGVPFATLASAPALNTNYTVTGSPAALRDSLGGAVTLRATGTSDDSIRIWSRQGPGATYYPELTLDFTPTP